MIASVTFTKSIREVPTTCAKCPFVDICAEALHGITKRGGMEYTVAAIRGRNKHCPLKIEEGGR